jgi:hypothetical protein
MRPDMIRCIVGLLTKEEDEYSTLKILELVSSKKKRFWSLKTNAPN